MKKVLPDLIFGPNISLLCAVDYNALQFYDIILAPFAESIGPAAIAGGQWQEQLFRCHFCPSILYCSEKRGLIQWLIS